MRPVAAIRLRTIFARGNSGLGRSASSGARVRLGKLGDLEKTLLVEGGLPGPKSLRPLLVLASC